MYLEINLSKHPFVHPKSNTDCSKVDSSLPRWEFDAPAPCWAPTSFTPMKTGCCYSCGSGDMRGSGNGVNEVVTLFRLVNIYRRLGEGYCFSPSATARKSQKTELKLHC
jgi:hypothetical protein